VVGLQLVECPFKEMVRREGLDPRRPAWEYPFRLKLKNNDVMAVISGLLGSAASELLVP
jgi:hypothetical protein